MSPFLKHIFIAMGYPFIHTADFVVYSWDKWINVDISKSIVTLTFSRLKVFSKGKIKTKMETFKLNHLVDVLIKLKFGI